jgi:RNA polymerase sigma factor (sigma-70 family)
MDTAAGADSGVRDYREFVMVSAPALRRALVAGFGTEVGQEAVSEALAYGWEHWDRLRVMTNPAGYLYRVGHRWALRLRRRREAPFSVDDSSTDPDPGEPRLGALLTSLSERQRTSVVLVEGYGWTYREAAEYLGISRGAVESHVRRGLERLRRGLEVNGNE